MGRKKPVTGHDRAFLDDVRAHPEDDTPRLIYADWLEDHGQAHRAEFIRLQCRLAQMSDHDPERLALEQRQADLLFVYDSEWTASLPAWAKKNQYSFRRGFLDRISITTTDFLRHGSTLFDVAPITDLELRCPRNAMPEIAASPLLGRLNSLEFADNLSPDDLRALRASPHLAALRAFALPETHLTANHAPVLVGWPIWPQLRSLVLNLDVFAVVPSLFAFGPLALRRLRMLGYPGLAECSALSEAASSLEHLEIPSSALTRESIRTLAKLPALTSLRVCGFGLADAIEDAKLLRQLSSLDLDRLSLTSEVLVTLARGSRLARLRRLSLGAPLNEAGVEALAAAPLDSLVHLDLHGNGRALAVEALAGSPHLASLGSLDLSNNKLGAKGATALAASPYLTRLTSLKLRRCWINAKGAAALAASPNLAGLRSLILSNNPLGDKGVRVLAGSPHLGELHTLELGGVESDMDGMEALARARGLLNLRRLAINGNVSNDVTFMASELADPTRLPRLLYLATGDHADGTALLAIGRSVVL